MEYKHDLPDDKRRVMNLWFTTSEVYRLENIAFELMELHETVTRPTRSFGGINGLTKV
jgi:hypothetical protein